MRWGVAVAVSSAACTALACGSGSGPIESVGSFQRDPSTEASGCLACGANLRCVGTVRGAPVDDVVATATSGGDCALDRDGIVRLRCDGTIVTGGQPSNDPQGTQPDTVVGTWTQAGGGFVVCLQGDCVVCTPTTDPTPPPPPPPDGDASVQGGGNGVDASSD